MEHDRQTLDIAQTSERDDVASKARKPNRATRAAENTREMGFDQYHEPADELSEENRTFARMIVALTEGDLRAAYGKRRSFKTS